MGSLLTSPFGILLLLLGAASWVYLIVCVRALRAGIEALAAELHTKRDALSEKTTLEQRGEILRRTGWIVSYLEEIDRKLSNTEPNLKVASITAENLVVKPSVGTPLPPRREEPRRAGDEGTMRIER
jgi:hypothetical protein